MNEKQILEMLREIVEAVDHDIAKEIFDDAYAEEIDQEEAQAELVEIVRRHLGF